MILLFDTETNGLPRNWKAPISDLANWPRLVQLAWLEYDREGVALGEADHIIQPKGFVITPQNSALHGITHQRALREGKALEDVLQLFAAAIDRADLLVAHNMSFDEKILGAEFLRTGIRSNLLQKSRLCTMQASTDFCAIPGPYGYKWPKLSELHHKLFGRPFAEMHNATADIQATARCFWELYRRNLIRM